MIERDILGDPISPPAPPRYQRPNLESRKWTEMEELTLWPVLATSISCQDYRDACVWLCNVHNHKPVCDEIDLEKESVSLIERRIITQGMDLDPEFKKFEESVRRQAPLVLLGYREGSPLSWAEKYKLIPGYWNKPNNGRQRIGLDEFLMFLGRSPRDRGLVTARMGELDDPKSTDEPHPGFERVSRGEEYEKAIKDARRNNLPSSWRELKRLCR